MKLISALLLLLLLLGAAAAAAPLTNDDVTKMVRAGLDEGIVIAAIQNSEPKFDTTPEGLIALAEAKVPKTIVTAMIERSAKKPPAEAQVDELTAAGIAEGLIPAAGIEVADETQGVVLQVGAEGQRLAYTKPSHVARVRGLGLGGAGGYLCLPGTRAKLRLTNKVPVFLVWLPRDAQPEQFVDLTVWAVRKNNTREIIRMNAGGFGGSVRTGFPSERLVALEFTPVGPPNATGQIRFQIKPRQPLAAGEYVLVVSGGRYFDFGVDP